LISSSTTHTRWVVSWCLTLRCPILRWWLHLWWHLLPWRILWWRHVHIGLLWDVHRWLLHRWLHWWWHLLDLPAASRTSGSSTRWHVGWSTLIIVSWVIWRLLLRVIYWHLELSLRLAIIHRINEALPITVLVESQAHVVRWLIINVTLLCQLSKSVNYLPIFWFDEVYFFSYHRVNNCLILVSLHHKLLSK